MIYIFGNIYDKSENEWLTIYRNDNVATNSIIIGYIDDINDIHQHSFYTYDINEAFDPFFGFSSMKHEIE
jgi:hypothetical protein